jgi:hypothetical protein
MCVAWSSLPLAIPAKVRTQGARRRMRRASEADDLVADRGGG